MGYLLQEVAKNERPRERLLLRGASALANHELLAILLTTGTKQDSVLTVAKNLLHLFPDLNLFTEATIEELKMCSGIGEAKAITILAAIEFGKRVLTPVMRISQIQSPKHAYLYLKDEMEHYTQEHVICLFLDIKSQVIARRTLSIGNTTQTIIDAKDIAKWGLKYSSFGVLLIHNHPSGNAEPSRADQLMTQKVHDTLIQLDIKLIDHIIIGKYQFYSFQEKQITSLNQGGKVEWKKKY